MVNVIKTFNTMCGNVRRQDMICPFQYQINFNLTGPKHSLLLYTAVLKRGIFIDHWLALDMLSRKCIICNLTWEPLQFINSSLACPTHFKNNDRLSTKHKRSAILHSYHIISFEPISKRATSKSFHEPNVKSVRTDVIDQRIISHNLDCLFSKVCIILFRKHQQLVSPSRIPE